MTTNTSPASASVWAVLRASQKDELYAARLAANLGEALKTLVGVRAWIRYQDQLVVPATALLYHLLTTGSGRQTLGEEYCSLLQSIGGHHLQLFRTTDLEELRAAVQYFFATAQAINNAAFYFTGRYLELGKRLLSIGYLSTNGGFFASQTSTSTSTLLGCLSALQVVLSLYSRYGLLAGLWNSSLSSPLPPEEDHHLSSTSTPSSSSSAESSPTKSCLLCLSPRRQSTLLPCGHIFCWPCLTSWLQFRAECPTCRRAIQETGRLVYLHNYG
ncbi:peroxisome biogenesis factor 10 [Tyrophagus putrescentiae]|nr:peroxisome biogenesis factor 10 [Tyrophagus putrescentiae]